MVSTATWTLSRTTRSTASPRLLEKEHAEATKVEMAYDFLEHTLCTRFVTLNENTKIPQGLPTFSPPKGRVRLYLHIYQTTAEVKGNDRSQSFPKSVGRAAREPRRRTQPSSSLRTPTTICSPLGRCGARTLALCEFLRKNSRKSEGSRTSTQ